MPFHGSLKHKAPTSGASSPGVSKSKKIRTSTVPNSSAVVPLTPLPVTSRLTQPHSSHQTAEKDGIVLRKFYPREMSNDRARAYTSGDLPKPIDELTSALRETAVAMKQVAVRGAVVHWFKVDLRTRDNRALAMASSEARMAGVPLVALYIISPQDWEAHVTAPVRVDFVLRTLQILKTDLAKLHIPLWIETVEKRQLVPARVLALMEDWGASHLFTNMEYEVDELRREAKMVRMCAERRTSMAVIHDTCVVPPGRLTSGSGRPYAVYTPWFRAWKKQIYEDEDLIEVDNGPQGNPPSVRNEDRFSNLFTCLIPEAPEGKKLANDDAERYRKLWPAGEREAVKRLEVFYKKSIKTYADKRNDLAVDGTSSLSVYFASGTLNARTAIQMVCDYGRTKTVDGGGNGAQSWISEIAWRDFYKHVLVAWPYVCMNKPFKPEYANIEWSYNGEHFAAWAQGRTGFPLVDAAMRQLLHLGWMHNRCRMVVASFLAKDLLLDWRLGERFFMEHLVDGDFASNNGGWGFAASVGVDPQPYFRIFNPLLQSEKFDPDGEYIRRWVPELSGVQGKAIHDPYARGAADRAREAGYPEPIVQHKAAREKAVAAYKKGLESSR